MNIQYGRNRYILLLVIFVLTVVAPIGMGAAAVDPTPLPETGADNQEANIDALDPMAEADKPPMVGGSPLEAPLVFAPERVAPSAPTSPPAINIWYGPAQNFGQVGKPQQWVNILGNVTSLVPITDLSYKLNGGATQPLTMGPDRRLDEAGDFNVEIDYEDLNPGNNTVVITAADGPGSTSSQTVTVNYTPGNVWPLPYSVAWNSVANLQNAVQIVDGLWTIQGNNVRTEEPGYDRILALGDVGETWKDYEVTAAVIAHGIDQDGFNSQGNGAGVGFIARWRGHYQDEDETPRQGWRDLGALAWFRWNTDNTKGIELRGNGGAGIDTNPNQQLTFGQPYMFKLSVLSTSPDNPSYYRFKIWEQGQPEPAFWDAEGFGKDGEPPTGSVLLLAHNVDVSFGAVTVSPLAGVRPIITRATDGNGIITLTPNQPSYSYAQRVGIQAVGNIGYRFSGWGGDLSGNQNPVVVNVTQDMNVTATFEAAPPPVVNVNSGGNGTVAVVPDKDEYQYGETITVTASANPGYLFAGWTGDLTGSQNPGFVVLNGDTSITANFAQTNPNSPISDDFNKFGCELNDELWTFVNPLGDGSLDVTGTHARISVPQGQSHNLWIDGNKAPRLMQAMANPQFFESVVKFESTVTQQFQMQGMIAEQGEMGFIRFEFQHNGGSSPRVYVAAIANGALSEQFSIDIPPLGEASYLRMTRAGSLWSFAYSMNGTDWVGAGGLEHDMTVNAVGVYGANHPAGGGDAPAHTAVVDYFFNSAAPIVPEDEREGCAIGLYLPMVVGNP